MLYSLRYYVDKRTGTFADALEAYGLAKVLSLIAQAGGPFQSPEVRIIDAEGYYYLQLSEPLKEVWLERTPYQALNPFVQIGKKSPPPPDLWAENLDVQYEKLSQLKAMRQVQTSKAKGKRTEEQREITEEYKRALEEWKPDENFPIWDAMQHTRLKALDAYNSGVLRWYAMREHFSDLLRVLLLCYSSSPNPMPEAESEWKQLVKRLGRKDKEAGAEMSAVQMYNPAMGKGVNRDKPVGASKGGLGNLWLSEYLKHVGMYMAGITLTVGDDRKTYVLCPREITLSQHSAIFSQFKAAFRPWQDHPFKADIMVVLTYTMAFLRYTGETTSGGEDPFDLTPSEAVTGFQTALYKSMGQAAAVMNMSFINLPVWVRPDSKGQVRPYIGALEEHSRVIEQLGRAQSGQFIGRGDQLNLLQEYRDFLSANELDSFLHFATGYSQYLTQAIENKWRYAMFTTQNLRRIITMSEPQLQEIVDSPGFLRIADAIRQSTVALQRKKAQGQPIDYDIRYGLGIELSRAATKRDSFIQALGDFIFKYDAETAQVQENRRQGKPGRLTIRQSDLDEVVKLVDQFGPQTVCALLVAYGYASSGKGKASNAEETEDQATQELSEDEAAS